MQFELQFFEEKVVDFIISKSNVKELKVSAEKLFSDDTQDKTVKKVKKKSTSSKTKKSVK